MLKITLDCWQQVAEVNRSGYLLCNCQIKPNFTAKKPSLCIGDGQESGKKQSYEQYCLWAQNSSCFDQFGWKIQRTEELDKFWGKWPFRNVCARKATMDETEQIMVYIDLQK